MGDYENQSYCNFNSGNAGKVAGKNVVLAVYDATGTDLYAVGGQQGLTINRSAEKIDTSDKLSGGWSSGISGMKEWSMDSDGAVVKDDPGMNALNVAFENGDFVCLKVVNIKTGQPLYGGLAVISDFSMEAPHDDVMTWSATLEGVGALTDLSGSTNSQMPTGVTTPIGDLVANTGAATGQIALAFSAPTGATAVTVETKTGTGAWTTATLQAALNASSTTGIITGLTTGTIYSVRLIVTGGTKAGISNVDNATAK